MAEQILSYDPSTNLELVLDPATGEQKSRKRFGFNASGVRYKLGFSESERSRLKSVEAQRESSLAGPGYVPAGGVPTRLLLGMDEAAGSSGFFDLKPGQLSAKSSGIGAPTLEQSQAIIKRHAMNQVDAPLGGGERSGIFSLDDELDPRGLQSQSNVTAFGSAASTPGLGALLQPIGQQRKATREAVIDVLSRAGTPALDIDEALDRVRFNPDNIDAYASALEGTLRQFEVQRQLSKPKRFGLGDLISIGLPLLGFASGGLGTALMFGGAMAQGFMRKKQPDFGAGGSREIYPIASRQELGRNLDELFRQRPEDIEAPQKRGDVFRVLGGF